MARLKPPPLGKPPWERLGVSYEQWFWDTVAMHYVPGPLCLCTSPSRSDSVCHLRVGHPGHHNSLVGGWNDSAGEALAEAYQRMTDG